MSPVSSARDVSWVEIVMDRGTEPFWSAACEERLVMPRCGDCGSYRWPPGPFCPKCRSQSLEWVSAGPGRVFSYTIVPQKVAEEGGEPGFHVPAVIQFPD